MAKSTEIGAMGYRTDEQTTRGVELGVGEGPRKGGSSRTLIKVRGGAPFRESQAYIFFGRNHKEGPFNKGNIHTSKVGKYENSDPTRWVRGVGCCSIYSCFPYFATSRVWIFSCDCAPTLRMRSHATCTRAVVVSPMKRHRALWLRPKNLCSFLNPKKIGFWDCSKKIENAGDA